MIYSHFYNFFIDDIFMPKESAHSGEMDEYEREIEEFKRCVIDSLILTLILLIMTTVVFNLFY